MTPAVALIPLVPRLAAPASPVPDRRVFDPRWVLDPRVPRISILEGNCKFIIFGPFFPNISQIREEQPLGAYKIPAKVKLVVGLLGADPEILTRARAILAGKFGLEEEAMPPIPFTWTRYYADELGESPWRSFISYETLIDREALVDIKRFTNDLEQAMAVGQVRKINLDPGYLTLGQFFLATTKDQRHRVYIRDGIFVEPTLYFQDGNFFPFEWTYRDYRSEEYRRYFLAARMKLAYQMHHQGLPYSRRKDLPDAIGKGGGAPGEVPAGEFPAGM
jgi:hypothetical protein